MAGTGMVNNVAFKRRVARELWYTNNFPCFIWQKVNIMRSPIPLTSAVVFMGFGTGDCH